MMDAISLFRDQDTRDELGLGTIRDALADRFFPGTSTIQTRARYFFFIPWIYLELERRQINASTVAQRARQHEIALISSLRKGGEVQGVLGAVAGDKLKRLPSSIYWQGLAAWGLRLYPGSRASYHRSLNGFYRANDVLRQAEDAADWREPQRHNWHPALRELLPHDFLKQTNFKLTADEGVFLRERIAANLGGTLLAWLALNADPWEPVDFPWQHPQRTALPPAMQHELDSARNFSEIIHGAPLLYNLMLAEHRSAEERITFYRAALEDWTEQVLARAESFASWDMGQDGFWNLVSSSNPNLPPATRDFVMNWLALVLPTVNNLADSAAARLLIHQRERHLKRSLARLDNQRALEMWSGAAGIGRLDYRWATAQSHVRDILEAGDA